MVRLHLNLWIGILAVCFFIGLGLLIPTSDSWSIMGVEIPQATELTRSTTNGSLLSGSYTGTVAINEPLALGVLDISFTLTDNNGALSGVLNDSGTLAYPSTATLNGNITGQTEGNVPTFRLDTPPFPGIVSGRPVTRSFRLEGNVLEAGAVISGTYSETIVGFTPQALAVRGSFLLSRAATVPGSNNPFPTPIPTLPSDTAPTPTATLPLGVTPTPGVTPIAGNNRIYLPVVSNRKAVLNAADVEVRPVATATPTPEPTPSNGETTAEDINNTYLPLVSQ